MSREKIAVLGSGLIGREIANHLSSHLDVTVLDNNSSAFKKLSNCHTIEADCLNREAISKYLKNINYVINALPGSIGFTSLKTLIELKKNIVDISFFPEDPLSLNQLALQNNITAIVDAGVAPGLSNAIVGNFISKLRSIVDKIAIYVGGLPQERKLPWEYQVVFSASDVIEEYTRPARIKRNGKIVSLPALSEPEYIDIKDIGTLEAFLTDGLRTVINSYANVPNMIEKTIRYPGHRSLAQALKESGFFAKTPLNYKDKAVIPFDFSTKILTKHWQSKGKDITILIVTAETIEKEIHKATLLDFYDKENNISSMARTTGYTACGVLELLLTGKIKEKGIIPPEKLGEDTLLFQDLLSYLQQRNIKVKFQ